MEISNINTPEGWAKYAAATNRKSFVHTFGREPIDTAEVTAWVNKTVEAALAGCEEPKKPEPKLEVVNGEMYWVTNFWEEELV